MFGLTAREMRRGFKAMVRESGETDEEFIIRVEEVRAEGGYPRE